MDKPPIPLNYDALPERKEGSVLLQILRGIIWTVVILATATILYFTVIPYIYLFLRDKI